MICEMCGKGASYLKTILVEGTRLQVCGDCSKFGVAPGSPDAEKEIPVVEARLEQREKRYKEKNVFERDILELVGDYSTRIRKARERKGWDHEELGKRLHEKRSVVGNLETGSIHPSEGLIKRLERVLDIKLMEKMEQVEQAFPSRKPSRGLTLGDMIKFEKE
ncbi:MAG: TIGR00270 family protein [Thermoplasmata archaeon]|nr:TIGR00270 family protein [Thermoplasmata archaeon]